MATPAQWSLGYARQARADFATFEALRATGVPECHWLQFLQMACEKLVKAHLCASGSDPATLQSSHEYVSTNLPIVIRQQFTHIGYSGPAAGAAFRLVKQLAQEINHLSPSVNRKKRPDNCEYPWEDAGGGLHVPLDWSFAAVDLLKRRGGINVLKLTVGAIERLLS